MPLEDRDALDATRLAIQRERDMAEIAARDREREYERGRREEAIAAHTAYQDKHLETINGSIGDLHEDMEKVGEHFTALRGDFDKFAAAQHALSESSLSNRTFLLGVLALVVPVLILLITIAANGGHL